MQPRSSLPPFRPLSASQESGPSPKSARTSATSNEFADAVARMFEKRERTVSSPVVLPRDDSSVALPRDDLDESENPTRPFLTSLIPAGALRGALTVVPLAIVAYLAAWYLYIEPQPASPAPRPAAQARTEAPPQPSEPVRPPAPPPRQEQAEVKPPSPAPAATPAAAPVQPAPPPDTRPLSRDEVRELQGKLSAVGFAAGPIDGVVGPQTQAAMRRYGEARNLAGPEARDVLAQLRREAPANPR